jgi:DNA polymerase-1
MRSSPHYVLINSAAGLEMVATALADSPLVALDLETTGLNPRSDRIRLLSVATGTNGGSALVYLVDCFAVNPSPLFDRLTQKELVIHHAAFDLAFLASRGFTPAGKVHDTMLSSQLLTAGTWDSNELAACCERHLGRALDKTEQRSDWSGALTGDQLTYAALDVQVLAPLLRAIEKQIRELGLLEAASIERRCLPALVWMGSKGIAFDVEACRILAAHAEADLQRILGELDTLAPKVPNSLDGFAGWNWDSTVQVKQVLGLLGFMLGSTADDALATVDHPLADLLRQHRAAAKRVTSYGRNLLEHVAPDGRVYPSWRQIGASSGRMACSNPNMQQLPRGEYRRCVVAPPGRVLIKADYSQIELRIAAKVSGDMSLLQAYQRGEDLHTLTARNVLGINEVTKQHRQLAKALNFGLLYGMGAKGFRQYAKSQYGLNLTDKEAAQYREAFFRSYPGLTTWHRRVKSRTTNETRTLVGRRLLLDDKTPDPLRLNTPIQGAGADGLKLALALLWERRGQVPGAFPVLAVHDEIVVEAAQDQAGAVAAWLKTAMAEAMTPMLEPVPVEVEVRISRTWGGD